FTGRLGAEHLEHCPACSLANCRCEIAWVDVFYDKRTRALAKRRLNLLWLLDRGENHDLHLGMPFSDVTECRETVHQRHPHVEQNDIGIDSRDHWQRLASGVRHAHYLDIFRLL